MEKESNSIEQIPLVSVCVTTYQHAPYIKECLDSILMQKTNFPIEIILGEDESTDGTREICKVYAEKHPNKIRLFLRSRKDVIYINGNPTGRYNFIENLKAAKGKYIALCEGDDYWTDPLKLQKQVDFLEQNSDFSLVFSNVKLIRREGEIISDAYVDAKYPKSFQVFHKPPGEFDIGHLSKGNIIHTPGVLFKNWLPNEDFPDYMNHVPIGDWPLHMYTARFGDIKYMDEVTAAYRITDSGIYSSSSSLKRVEMSLLQYPYMISDGVFDESIVIHWKKMLPGRISKYLKMCNQNSIPNKSKHLMKIYSKNVPDVLNDLLFLLVEENDDLLRRVEDFYNTRTFRLMQKISKVKSLFRQ